MDPDLTSGPNTSKRIERSREGGSTSSSDRRESDTHLEEPGTTTSEPVGRARVTENPNDIAGVQTTDAHTDLVNSEDSDHTSEQGGGSSENVSSKDLGNDSSEGTGTGPSGQEDTAAVATGNEQAPDDWTLVDHEKSDHTGTVRKGEVCRQMEKNSGIITEVQQQITQLQYSLHSDDGKSLKSDRPVVEKVSETEGDGERKDVQATVTDDDQATREASPAAASQGETSSPATVEVPPSEPDVVASKAQGVGMLSTSGSLKETHDHSKPQETLRLSKSLKETSTSIKHSNSLKESCGSEEALITKPGSGTQKEINGSSEASSTIPASESQEEVDMGQEDPSAVPASAAQELSSETSATPSTVEDSETQKQVILEDPGTASRSESLKEVVMSPKPASEVSASEAQEGKSIISEEPTSEAQIVGVSQEASSVVSNSVVDSSSEAFSNLTTSEVSGSSGLVSTSEVPKDVGLSSDSGNKASTPEAQEEIGKSSNTVPNSEVGMSADAQSRACETGEEIGKSSNTVPNSEVQNEVGVSADAQSRACETGEEISASPEAAGTAPTSEAQKDSGTSPEEIAPRTEVPSRGSPPEGLQRKGSHIDEDKTRDSLQRFPQQSETTVSLPQGKETSVPQGDPRESDYALTSPLAFIYELAQKDKTIKDQQRKADQLEARVTIFKGKLQALSNDYEDLSRSFTELRISHAELSRSHGELSRSNAELRRSNAELQRQYQDLDRAYRKKDAECAHHSEKAQSYADAYARMKHSMTKENNEKEKLARDLRSQLEQVKKECSTLQDQMSLYEQQHASAQSRGGSYLDDTKAATPALLVSALNGVKDASNNFVKVFRSSIHPGLDTAQLEEHIGAVSRNGHTKFQYQAYICRILFGDFEMTSKLGLHPTTYFRQYQIHDLKKTDTVEKLLRYDEDIDASLHEFCFDKFLMLMLDVQDVLIDRSVDLKQQVLNKQHPRESKLYVSFCKLAVSVWLLQRLAFSFLHPARPFIARREEPFDLNRMSSVVPLDEPGADEEVQLRVGFYVLPGFDIGNSAIPCEVYVK